MLKDRESVKLEKINDVKNPMPKLNIINRNIIIELYADAFLILFFKSLKLLDMDRPPDIMSL